MPGVNTLSFDVAKDGGQLAQLLLVVALERIVARGRVVRSSDEGGVYFGEEAQDVLRRDLRVLSDSLDGAHDCEPTRVQARGIEA